MAVCQGRAPAGSARPVWLDRHNLTSPRKADQFWGHPVDKRNTGIASRFAPPEWSSTMGVEGVKTRPVCQDTATCRSWGLHTWPLQWVDLPIQSNLWKNTSNRLKTSFAVISCPLLRDRQSATLSGICSVSRLVSEEWPCATQFMKHGLTLTRPLRWLLQWCTVFQCSWRQLCIHGGPWLAVSRTCCGQGKERGCTSGEGEWYPQPTWCPWSMRHVTRAREGCIDLVDSHSNEWACVCSLTGRFLWRDLPEVRLETSTHAKPLLRRRAIHCGACTELQSRWLRVPSPQWSEGPHRSPVRDLQ